MKVLALDVSSKSTGWFVTKRSCGFIRPPGALPLGEKLIYFRKELLKLLVRYKPEVVVLEDTYFRRNIHTLKVLSQFGGVATEVCAAAGCKIVTLTTTEARRYCCGKQEGKFDKKGVFEYFVSKYGLEDWTYGEYNDITDAMALFWGYRAMKKLEE